MGLGVLCRIMDLDRNFEAQGFAQDFHSHSKECQAVVDAYPDPCAVVTPNECGPSGHVHKANAASGMISWYV